MEFPPPHDCNRFKAPPAMYSSAVHGLAPVLGWIWASRECRHIGSPLSEQPGTVCISVIQVLVCIFMYIYIYMSVCTTMYAWTEICVYLSPCISKDKMSIQLNSRRVDGDSRGDKSFWLSILIYTYIYAHIMNTCTCMYVCSYVFPYWLLPVYIYITLVARGSCCLLMCVSVCVSDCIHVYMHRQRW